MLEVPSANIETASNGLEGYEKAIAGNFDLIMMDLNMPVMGGFESTKKIKDYFDEPNLFLGGGLHYQNKSESVSAFGSKNLSETIGPHSPYIVALSASEIDSDLAKKLKEYKFDDWFTSPLDSNTIINEIVPKLLFRYSMGYVEDEDESHLQHQSVQSRKDLPVTEENPSDEESSR